MRKFEKPKKESVRHRRVDVGDQGGEFVTEQFATANPDITAEEAVKPRDNDPAYAHMRIMDPLESELLESLGRVELADDGDYRDGDAIRKDCARIVDAILVKAGLPLKTEDLTCSEALTLYEKGMGISRPTMNLELRKAPGRGILAFQPENEEAVPILLSGMVLTWDDLNATDWRAS
jgi:hypothetical protein